MRDLDGLPRHASGFSYINSISHAHLPSRMTITRREPKRSPFWKRSENDEGRFEASHSPVPGSGRTPVGPPRAKPPCIVFPRLNTVQHIDLRRAAKALLVRLITPLVVLGKGWSERYVRSSSGNPPNRFSFSSHFLPHHHNRRAFILFRLHSHQSLQSLIQSISHCTLLCWIARSTYFLRYLIPVIEVSGGQQQNPNGSYPASNFYTRIP